MKKLVLAGAALLAVAGAGVAQNAAAPAKGAALDQSVLEAQVLLDRADFSPGVIDGQGGPVFEAAVRGFQQAHDIKNLFVMDGSGFTSSACQNPTLTIMALAVRSCDYLMGEMKKRNV